MISCDDLEDKLRKRSGGEKEMEVKENKEDEKFSIIDWCEKHLALLTAVSSILSIGLTGLFKCASYWYEKGYYDFWGIPLTYMQIDYNKVLMQFLLTFSGILITYVVGIVYIEIYNYSKLRGKVLLHILLLFINTGIIIFATYSVGGTIYDVFNFANQEVLGFFIGVEAFLYVIELVIIFCFSKKKPKKEKVKKVKKEKVKKIKHSKQKLKVNNQEQKSNITKSNNSKGDSEKNEQTAEVDQNEDTSKTKGEEKKFLLINRRTALFILFLVVIVIGSIDWTYYNLYNERKEKCEDTKKFEVMLDFDGQEYIILSTYDDKYFVKPCIVSKEQHSVTINSDKYKLIEIGVNEVNIYDFSEFEGVLKRLNNDEFMNLQSN
jgi:hypothetical protein